MKKVKLPNRPLGPFPTALVGVDVDGRPNYATVGAFGVVSLEPVLYVSLKSTHYTNRGVKENGCFSINIPSTGMVEMTDYCGIVSGHKVDKSGVFTSFYDDGGRAPMISECPMNILCRVVECIPRFGFDLYLGEIAAVYLDEECLSDGVPDPLKIDPIIMMSASYCGLAQVVGTVFREGKAKAQQALKEV